MWPDWERMSTLKRENRSKENSKIKSQKAKVQLKSKKFGHIITGLIYFGISLIFLSLLIFILTFFPIIKEEIKYAGTGFVRKTPTMIQPVDKDFGIIIPKILANAKVVANVDPYDSKAYQAALTKGVAHAAGTAFPGHAGNTFIFAHSSVDWYIANRYNSVFYLLHKLEKGDEIDMYYKGKKFVYKVTDKKYVEASDVSYLNSSYSGLINQTPTDTSTLTLMTCWPPGTTLKRLIIQAKISN